MTIIFPPDSRVIAYCRDSGGINQELSVTQQKESIGLWCAENGVILTRIFEDTARSGTSTTRRDAFLEMIAYLDGNVPEKGVIVWEYARIARQYDDFAYFVADLRRHGYIVHSISDNVPEGLDGRLLESIGAWKNAKYSEDLKRNTRRGLNYITSIHHANFTHCPFGYKRKEINIGKRRDGRDHILHQLEIEPAEAARVKLAFSMRATGATYKEINESCRIYAWLSHYGGMLSNPVYIGRFRYGGMEIPDYCPPIIDIDTWTAVQEVNRQRIKRYGYNHPRAVRSNYLLTGLLYCGKCGSRMAGRVWHQRKPYTTMYHYYFCQSENSGAGTCGAHYIPQDEIENAVIETVKSRILQRDILMQVYEAAQAQSLAQNGVKDMEMAALRQSMANNERQINHVLSAIKEAGHSRMLLVQLNLLEAQQVELQQQMAQIDTRIVPIVIPSIDDVISYITNELANADRVKLAQVLRGLIVSVKATKDYKLVGEINYRLPIGSGEYTVAI